MEHTVHQNITINVYRSHTKSVPTVKSEEIEASDKNVNDNTNQQNRKGSHS